jgi:hypothetical protein
MMSAKADPVTPFGIPHGVWTPIEFLDPHTGLWFPCRGTPFELEEARRLHKRGLIVRATKRIDGVLHVVVMPSRPALMGRMT